MDERSIVELPAVPENPSNSRMIPIKDDARGLERTDCAQKPRLVVLRAPAAYSSSLWRRQRSLGTAERRAPTAGDTP
jgi:hypothetical protein